MVDETTPATPTDAVPPAPPRKRRRWLRRLLLLAALAVVGGIGLVALAPTILSTRPIVGIALKQVNQRLNGRVEVNAVSLGWTSGVRVDGVRVFDDANAQIAQVDHLTCPMPLWKAATGKFALGHTVVDGLTFDAKVDSQGRINFAQLAKKSSAPTPSTPAATSSPTPTTPVAPSKLPDVSGDFELTNAHGTVSQASKPTVYLTKLAGSVKVPSINDPIVNHLDATLHVGDAGPDGHILADGTASVVKANLLDIDGANVHQVIDATGVDLGAVKSFVKGLDQAAGLIDAHLAADVTAGKSAVVDASVTGKQRIVVGGPLLRGDTFGTDTFVAAVPKLSAEFPQGLAHWQGGHLTVGVNGDPILCKLDQGQVTLLVDVVPQALLNLADSKAPGSAGRIELVDHFDAGKIVGQLKNTAHLSDEATLTGGTLDQTVKLAMTADRGTVNVTTDLKGVTGTRKGQPVAIQPISLTVAGTSAGTGKLLDSLRDLKLTLSSKFANADFHGANVGDLTGTLTAQLQALQAEAEQLVDFGGKQIAGDLAVHLADSGQLMQPPYAAKVKADATVTNLQYATKDGPIVAEPMVRVDLTGDLQGSEKAAVEAVKNLLLAVKAGAAAAPTVDLAVEVPSATLGDAPEADFKVTRFNADLAPLQKQFANVPAGTVGTVIAGGAMTLTTSGHYGKDGVRLDPTKLSLAKLFVTRQLPNNQQVNAIAGDSVVLTAAGSVGLTDASKSIHLTDLSIADTAKILDVHKGDGELTVTQAKDALSGRGQLAVMVELGSVNDILRVLGRSTVDAPTPGGRVRTGHLTGTLTFAAATGKTDVTGDFVVPNLDVVPAAGPGAGPQKVTLALKASADEAAHRVIAPEIRFQSPFASATVSDVQVALDAKSTVDKLQKALLAVDVPDMKTLAALGDAFSAPAPQAPAPKPGDPAAAAVTPPLQVMGGTFSMKADVSHDGNNLVLNVPTLTANNLAFTRGKVDYKAKPITAKLAARVGTADGDTLMKQLRGLTVTALDANAGVATVSLATPISIADLSNPAASATGEVKVDGDLGELSQLAAAFGGKPADAYPYRGHLVVTQKVVTDASSLALQGSINVADFKVMQGSAVQFAEPMLAVANDVAVPPDLSAVGIRNLSVAMRSSNALNVAITNGRVDDLKAKRTLKLPVALHYDLAKLWPIVHPMLLTPGEPDKYADVKISGTFDRPATIAGSYPANVPFTEAVKTLAVDCGLSVGAFEHSGLTVKNLDVPVTIRNGKAVTVDGNGNAAGPAIANDGQLDLGHVTIDLTQDPMRVSMPANKALLTHATVNPLFTDTFLNDYVNNPVFVGTKNATGLVDVTVLQCDRFPAGALAQQAVAANDGVLRLKVSLTDLHIGSAGIGTVLGKALNNEGDQPDSFSANVRDGTVSLVRGVSTQDMTFQTGRYAVPFKGDVILATKAFRNFTIGLPGAAIAKLGTKDQRILNLVPKSVSLPINGTLSSPQVDFAGAAGSVVQGVLSNPANIGALLQKGGNTGGSNANGQPKQSDDPLGDLLNGLTKKKDNNSDKGKKQKR